MGKKFSISDLDSILGDAIDGNELNNLQNEIKSDEDEELIPDNSVSPQIANMVNQRDGLTVDYSRVYKQLERLIENGNIALEVLAAIDPDISNGQVGSTTASLINAIKNCVAEFTKIHLIHIKYEQALRMEDIRHKHKMEELEKRESIINARNGNNTIDVNPESVDKQNGNVLIPFNTENVMEYMNYLRQKQGKLQ